MAPNPFAIKPWSKNGKTVYAVDLRKLGKGRRFFSSQGDAADYLADVSKHGMEAALSPEERADVTLAKARLKGAGRSESLLQVTEFFLKFAAGKNAMTFSRAAGVFLDAKEASGKRPRYLNKLRWLLASMERVLPTEIMVHEISRAQIEEWLAAKKAASTRKFCLQDVRTFFKSAVRNGWCAVDPCEGIESIEVDGAAPVIFTVAQAENVMRRAEERAPELIPYLVLALFCGLRPDAEIKGMSWGQIDFEANLVEVVTTKLRGTRKRRFVTLQPNAKAFLKIAYGRLSKAERGPESKIFFERRAFRRFRCDFTLEERGGNGGQLKKVWKQVVDWSHDICRHSFCSYHVAMFKDEVLSAKEAGHSVAVLHSNYRQLVKPKEAETFWGILPSPSGRPQGKNSR